MYLEVRKVLKKYKIAIELQTRELRNLDLGNVEDGGELLLSKESNLYVKLRKVPKGKNGTTFSLSNKTDIFNMRSGVNFSADE